MKFLKKLSLAASIAAVSVAANAEMVAMDEASLSATTGQAGVTITSQLGSGISIDEVLYTDTTDGFDGDGGSLSIDSLVLSGSVTLVNVIDIKANGDLVIDNSSSTLSGLNLSIASVDTVDDSGIDALNIASGISIDMDVVGSVMTLSTDVNGDTTLTSSGGSLTVTNMDATLLNGGIGISGLTVSNMSTDSTLTFNTAGVTITGLDLDADIAIADLSLGANSIGSIALNGLNMSGVTTTIAGH